MSARIDLDVRIEPDLVIDSRFEHRLEVPVVHHYMQEIATVPLAGSNHLPGNANELAHGGEIVAIEATQQPVAARQLRCCRAYCFRYQTGGAQLSILRPADEEQ